MLAVRRATRSLRAEKNDFGFCSLFVISLCVSPVGPGKRAYGGRDEGYSPNALFER